MGIFPYKTHLLLQKSRVYLFIPKKNNSDDDLKYLFKLLLNITFLSHIKKIFYFIFNFLDTSYKGECFIF